MSSYTLHVLIDTEDKQDVFRDIKISSEQTLMDLHQAILDAFAFTGQEMSSFFACDDNWDEEQEYTQIAMDPKNQAFEMGVNTISTLFNEKGDKALYQYDFLRMWSFLIELINISPEECPEPVVLLSVGEAPNEEDKEISELPSFNGQGGLDSFDNDLQEDDEFGEESYDSYDDESYY